MPKSRNQAFIDGHLGADPEVKTTTGGRKVCTFPVATSEKWKDKSGADKESTQWHKCVAWGALADTCGALKKGAFISLEGKIQTRSWEQGGEKKYITEIVLFKVHGQDKEKPAPESGSLFDGEAIRYEVPF